MDPSATPLIPPAQSAVWGVPAPALHGLLLVVAAGTFAFILWRRLDLLRRSAPDPRSDHPGRRLGRLLVVGFAQSRQPRYLLAGILHIVIFAGFLILLLRSLTLLGEGFVAGFALPGLGGRLGPVYASIKDYTALLVLVACVVAVVRRAVFRPARYRDRHAKRSHTHEAYVVLALIAALMIADALHEGSRLAADGVRPGALPFASAAALALTDAPADTLRAVHLGSFWAHNAMLLFFLCYLPVSKHFHVITALPNVFLTKLGSPGAVKPVRHGVVSLEQVERIGVQTLEDFTWKHLLDFYSCTDCGRCSDHCPAYATGTPLSPRMISVKCRDAAYDAYAVLGRNTPADRRPELVGQVVSDAELWACTTCGACEEACPVLIEYVDKIVDMRRFLVEEGRVPRGLQKALADLEKRGNPYGKPPRKRGDWVDGAGAVRPLEAGQRADYLLFTDSCAAYDPRIQQIARAFGRLLTRAGVDAATLGAAEVDSGNEARRLGEEGLFEALRDANRQALAERSFDRVATTDPHAYNALRHDYGLEQPVLHHSQLLASWLDEGRLRPGRLDDDKTYTFHDPCYLGRHNAVYDAPRRVLAAVPGLRTVEMERTRNRSFCCGGGSLYLFHEGEAESRMGERRLEMAAAAGADVVVTACPFCLINLEDAIKTTGREGQMEVLDLVEVVERALDGPPRHPTSRGEAGEDACTSSSA